MKTTKLSKVSRIYSPDILVWERQIWETDNREWGAFRLFRDLGMLRSVPAARNSYLEHRGDKQRPTSVGNWGRWHKGNEWAWRALQYDNYQERRLQVFVHEREEAVMRQIGGQLELLYYKQIQNISAALDQGAVTNTITNALRALTDQFSGAPVQKVHAHVATGGDAANAEELNIFDKDKISEIRKILHDAHVFDLDEIEEIDTPPQTS